MGYNQRTSLPHSSAYMVRPTGTHICSTPTFYWDKEGKRQTNSTGLPTRGVQASSQHSAQQEYILYRQEGQETVRRPRALWVWGQRHVYYTGTVHLGEGGGGIDTDLQIGGTVFSCADGEEESCGQEVPFTYLQEQISPQRWVLREEGMFILTVHRNRYGKKCGFAEGKMLLGWSVPTNSIHEPRKRKQAQSYRTREVYPTGTSPSTPSRPQRSQSSSTVAMTRSTSPRWKLSWSGPAAVWSQRARTALGEVKKGQNAQVPGLARPMADCPCWFSQHLLDSRRDMGHPLTC